VGSPSPFVINMWSGPRNVSTALMYSWRQRTDTQVFDEPFYGIYLRQFDPGHPGRNEIIDSMPLDFDATISHITADGKPPVRYIKNICHHLDALDESVLDLFTNVLLIREPSRVLASLTATLGSDFSIDITGLEQQVRILDHEIAAGRTPLVLDSGQLLSNPRHGLTKLCDLLGVPFDDAMLSWPAGPKPEDGYWAKFWYRSAHQSTGFRGPEITPEGGFSHPLLDACVPLYERLAAHRVDL